MNSTGRPGGGVAPARYTAGDKFAAAHHGLATAVGRGYSPLLASVTGSALRGLDHAGSDLDILVAVMDPLPRPIADVTEDLDLTIASLPHILGKAGESVPYAEWAASPYLVTQGAFGDAWLPMLRAMRYNRYSLAAHARSMARNTAARQPDLWKAARLVLATYRFTHTAPGVAVQPRSVFDLRCEDAPAAADWLEDVSEETGYRVETVAGLLRSSAFSH